jgi:hypothetical protein
MYKALALAVGLVWACLCLSGCTGPGGGLGPEHDFVLNSYGQAKLLYVESVEFPEFMIANEPFDVEIEVSASLDPELLRGVGRLITFEASGGKFMFGPQLTGPSLAEPPDIILFETWVPFVTWDGRPIIFDDPPSDTATFRLALPASDYTFQVSSADGRERGGMEGTYLSTPSYNPLSSEHAIYREYPFTVLPKEEGAG